MIRQRIVIAPVLLLATLATHPAYCNEVQSWQDIPGPHPGWTAPDLTGSVRAGYFSSPPDFDRSKDAVASSLWLKAQGKIHERLSYLAAGWMGDSDIKTTGNERGRLREGYFGLRQENWDARLGKQIIIWGRADRFNPTDNLTPRDYTMIAPEETDQREGVMAAEITRRTAEVGLTAIWLDPHLRPNRLPLSAPSGVRFEEPDTYGNQGALRIDHSGGDIDWSLSYFNGLDLNPGFAVDPALPEVVRLTHTRIRVLGMDAATVTGRYGFRAEAAYTWTSNRNADDWLRKKDFFYAVVGAERTFFDNLNVNIQIYARHVTGYRPVDEITDPGFRALAVQAAVSWNQLEQHQYGFTFRIADRWLHETLEGELAGLYSLTRNEYVFRPRLTYSFTDAIKGTMGIDLYRGAPDTFFGQFRSLSSAFVEVRYGF